MLQLHFKGIVIPTCSEKHQEKILAGDVHRVLILIFLELFLFPVVAMVVKHVESPAYAAG